jgi:hypothetical protein
MKSYADDPNTPYRRFALPLPFALANFEDPIK